MNNYNILPPRADLNQQWFEDLIYQKGRRVLLEKAIQCPCKSPSTNQQSSCRNCGGAGWVYVNQKETRMVIQGVAVSTEFKAWSEESRGMIRVTCNDREQLTFMDRITLLDANAIYSEVLFFRQVGSEYVAFSAYPIKKLLYGGLYIDNNTQLQILSSTLDFTYGSKNIVKLRADLFSGENTSVSVRYYHAPQYNVLELSRETMQSFKYEQGQEIQQQMPLSAMARRTHYIQGAPNIEGEAILDNYYVEDTCESTVFPNVQDCVSSQVIIVPPNSQSVLRFTFVNLNQLTLVHNLGREPVVTIYDSVNEQIQAGVKIIDSNTVEIDFSTSETGVVIIS